MAVSANYTFDYEMPLGFDGALRLRGTAINLQTLCGSCPGILGRNPLVDIKGDRVELTSVEVTSPTARIIDALLVVPATFSDFVMNVLVDRKAARASAYRLTLALPGLALLLRPTGTIRVEYAIESHSLGPDDPIRANVTLREGSTIVEAWPGVDAM